MMYMMSTVHPAHGISSLLLESLLPIAGPDVMNKTFHQVKLNKLLKLVELID